MRILMVCHAPPCSRAAGPGRRHLGLFNALAERHRVSVVTLAEPGDREQFEEEHRGRYEHAVFVPKRSAARQCARILGHLATGHSQIRHAHDRRVQTAMDRLFATTAFEVVYVSTVLLGCYRWPAHVAAVGDAHNVEHELFERISHIAPNAAWRMYYRLQAWLTERDERRLAGRFSAIWATSARDAAYFAAARGDERVFVVPNGVDTTAAPPPRRQTADTGPTLLYVGIMSYRPNADAAEYLIDRLLPRIRAHAPTVKVQIVGANPPRSLRMRAGPGVEVVGWVPDVAPYYERASVFVVPLRAGGGTRLKVLEALQFRVPVVSTSLGCEGLQVEDAVLLADTDETLADAVLRVWRDPHLAGALAARGAALVRSRYDWSRIGESLEDVLARTVGDQAPALAPAPRFVTVATRF